MSEHDKLSQAKLYLRYASTTANSEVVLNIIMNMMRDAVEPLVPATDRDKFALAVDTVAKEAKVRVEELQDISARVVAEIYTDAELDALVVFYNSPLGRSIGEKQGVVFSATSQAGAEWGRKLVKELTPRLLELTGIEPEVQEG